MYYARLATFGPNLAHMSATRTLLFDLGGVLIDWNPRYVYRAHFDDDEKMEWFLANITDPDWNENQDAGYSLHAAMEEKVKEFPDWETEIRMYYGDWEAMLGGPIEDMVSLFRELRAESVQPIYALTNWSAETFPVALERYGFLHDFDGIVVSGVEKMRKPDPKFYQLALDRYDLQAENVVFIDDNLRNIEAARAMGITGIHHTDFTKTRRALEDLGFLGGEGLA